MLNSTSLGISFFLFFRGVEVVLTTTVTPLGPGTFSHFFAHPRPTMSQKRPRSSNTQSPPAPDSDAEYEYHSAVEDEEPRRPHQRLRVMS